MIDGEIEMIAAMLEQIRKDLRSVNLTNRRAALAWCDGAHASIFEWANLIGIDAAVIRTQLLKGTRYE